MVSLTKEELIEDTTFRQVYQLVRKNHQPAPHTIKVLTQNKHVKDFCEEAVHFVELPGSNKESLYISYIVSSWINRNKILVRIDSVTFYDNWNEYQKERLSGLHSGAANHNVELN